MAQALSATHLAVGRALRQLRERQGLNQAQAAELVGMHDRWLSGAERGLHNITVRSLHNVLDGLGEDWTAFGRAVDAELGKAASEHQSPADAEAR